MESLLAKESTGRLMPTSHLDRKVV